MSAIRAAFAILLLLCGSCARASDNHQNYQRAFDVAYSEYKSAYHELNKTVENCSLQKRADIDFDSVAKEIPSDLTKPQLSAALYFMKKYHSDMCERNAIGNYMQKAHGLNSLINLLESKKIKISARDKIGDIRKLLFSREKTIFFVPDSYLSLLANYQSISAQDRSKIESIAELQSDYNLVKLLNALERRGAKKN